MDKIVITGPESTGKTMLSQELSAYFGTLWVPEYARYYLNHLSRPYLPEDVLKMARGQLQWEAVWEKYARHLLVCDTNLLVHKIWMEHKYGICDLWIEDQLRQSHNELYLLCDTDLPWEDDPQREHPEDRILLFEKYRVALESMKVRFAVIHGRGSARLDCAIKVSRAMLSG
ncbi:MAG: ATP-binding protein [Saprospiraceae bacterium]|nr:ATP-binding protein [Saprospiraceae bacterium]